MAKATKKKAAKKKTTRKTKSKATKKKTKSKKMGRPTSFSERLVMRILELAKAGKTDNQIAIEVGISTATLNNWKGKHPDFFTALKDAKDVADQLVEAALFQKGVGYSHTAVKFFWNPKGNNGQGAVVSQPYVERHPPDTTACIFWLKNRQPEKWRDVSRRELTGKDGKPLDGPQIVVTLPSNGREAKE